jgi:DNA-binding beta-propeller fold protein YncE
MASRSKKKKAPKRRRGRRGLMVFVTLVALALGLGAYFYLQQPEAEVVAQTRVERSLGVKGAGEGQLDSPRGIAFAPSGELVVADLNNSRVVKFAADGHFLLSFGKPSSEQGKGKPGEFTEPSGIACDKDGNIYVADSWNGRIQKFDPKGHYLSEYGGAKYTFYSPRNVAVDRAGVIYVADTGNSAIKAIAPDGKLLKSIGGRGDGNGLFGEVFGVAVNSKGEIFAADPGNRRVHKFAPLPGAAFLKEKKVAGWQSAHPFWPHLAIDQQDNVYVVDGGNRKVWVYDSELNYRGTIGGAPGQELFSSPLGIAFSPDGALHVSEVNGGKVLRLGPVNLPAPAKR